jgi:hypothetical protein
MPSHDPYWDQVSPADALPEHCAKCGAAPGESCTYLSDIFVYDPPGGGYYPRVKQLKHRKGAPLADGQVHKERRVPVRARRYREYRKSLLDRRPVVPMSQDARQAAAAMRAWDIMEHEKLRAWLAEYGDILL